MMRRQGQYADSGGNAYASAQMQHMPAQSMELKSGQFQGQLEAFTPERDQPYRTSKSDGQWRWERDEGQGTDGSRTYFQGQRPDPNLSVEKQNADLRPRSHDEDMEIAYEQNLLPPTLEGLEKKFHDDVMKLAKEQNDAEDAENTRHREKINAINAQYQEQLTALRERHANHRDDNLRKESFVRQQQYQKAMMDYYPHSNMAPADTMPTGNTFDPYRERSHFLGAAREQGFEPRGARKQQGFEPRRAREQQGFEPRGSYQGGRAYDTGSRYY